MLAMKENVRVGFDFSQRILHGTETSRRYAAAKAEIQNPKAQAPRKHQASNNLQIGKRAAVFRLLGFGASLGFGTWGLGFRMCAALARLTEVITGRL